MWVTSTMVVHLSVGRQRTDVVIGYLCIAFWIAVGCGVAWFAVRLWMDPRDPL